MKRVGEAWKFKEFEMSKLQRIKLLFSLQDEKAKWWKTQATQLWDHTSCVLASKFHSSTTS